MKVYKESLGSTAAQPIPAELALCLSVALNYLSNRRGMLTVVIRFLASRGAAVQGHCLPCFPIWLPEDHMLPLSHSCIGVYPKSCQKLPISGLGYV